MIINKVYVIVILISSIVFTALMIGYNSFSTKSNQDYFQQSRDSFDSNINSTINQYEIFSSYIYDTIIDDTVLSLMNQASQGTELQKDATRDLLYDSLIDNYNIMVEYNFRQLHFHLPNGDSFLRFHSPDAYGDNLLDVRTAIRIVNTEHIYVKGFEEGRIYNGYRFVYPLFYHDTYVGSVEI